VVGDVTPLGKSAETQDLALLYEEIAYSRTPDKNQPQGVDSDEQDTYV